MSQTDIDALNEIRSTLVASRRAAAASGDVEAVISAQREVALVDEAISDEQALGQQEKDELAITRAMNTVPNAHNVDEISLVSDPIRIAD